MTFDATLNLAWVLLGALALTSTFWASRHLARKSGRRRFFEVVGVASITLALFPYISATDDVLRIEQYTSQHEHQQGGRNSSDLVRLFEAADHPLVSRASQISLTLSFFELVIILPCWGTSRIAPLTAGRSPPLLVAA